MNFTNFRATFFSFFVLCYCDDIRRSYRVLAGESCPRLFFGKNLVDSEIVRNVAIKSITHTNMSNNTDPRFTVWKEHSNIFQDSRYILYDGGVYKKGFDDENEAIQYAKMITEVDPKDELISYRDGYKIIKSWSYVYNAFRFVVYKYESQGGINFFDYVNSFPTRHEAIDMVCDERYHPELFENKGAPDPVQIFPAQ